ncbi:MAG TPA: hypothetical protein VHM00_07825 [Caldimonas sp.]|nr:hypothetical protein [Caldimonas sp.]HEX2540977.1 hypothetical protein [Caldimonas sp.]
MRLPPASRSLLVAILCGLTALHATAQERDEKTYDGRWAVRLQGVDGVARDATVVLEGYDGTWQYRTGAGRGAKSACAGKKLPLTVQSSTRTLLAFTVWGETGSPACPTLTIVARPTGEKAVEGTADLGSDGSERPEVLAAQSAPAFPGAWSAASAVAAAKRVGTAGSLRMTRR